MGTSSSQKRVGASRIESCWRVLRGFVSRDGAEAIVVRNRQYLYLLLAVLGTFCAVQIASAQIPAFPGAEGPGAKATGGRGGDVYHVTTLDADKNGVVPGSLQYGINNAPANGRTIVFDVGGTIYLGGLTANDTLRYGKANVTIAGQ